MYNYKDRYKKIEDMVQFLSKMDNSIDEERFLELTFNKLFSYSDKADLGSLYQFTDKSRVKFIDAIGHNLKYLKKSDLHLLDFEHSTGEISIVKKITEQTKKLFIKNKNLKEFKEYTDNVVDVKETLLIPLFYEDKILAEYAIEISHDSKNNFIKKDLEFFDLLKKIIENKFNEIIYKNKANNRLKLMEEKYKEELRIDNLTGLYNKKYFYQCFKKGFNENLNSKNNIGLIMIDIDFFKNYNDVYGHIKGDEALIKIANTLKKEIRQSTDTIFRYGGEEFVAIIKNTDKKEILKIAQRLKKSVESLRIINLVNGEKKALTISLGICIHLDDFKDNELLLNYADKALYKAKALGRNQIYFYNKKSS